MKILQITENISHTSKRIHDIEKEKGVKPGTPEWFKLWFSLPYLKESITEAFDNPYEFKVTHNDGNRWQAQALTDNNIIISFLASNVDTGWGIDFKTADADTPNNTTYDLTGKGDGQRTMTTVLAMLKQFIQDHSPEEIYFDAAKDAGNSRTNLYQRIVQRFAGGLGYTVDVQDAGNRDDFTLVRKVQETTVNEVSKEEFDAIRNGYVDIEFDKKWWPLSSDYPLIKHIGEAIGATSWTSWGKVGVPWSEKEMIGGGGTYMLKGDFGHILLDASKSFRPDKILMSQISTSNRGGGVGVKVMNAIKSYADQKNLPFTVYKVTNKKFFDKFEWLTKKGEDTYEYNSSKNESITEALNNPYSYYWDETYNDDSSFLAKAEMDMGELMVMFSVGEPGVSWTIDFAVDGSMHKTGDGDQFRIFATVVAVIKDWAANKVDLSKVTQIDFSSDKDGVGEDSRSKLYKRFGQQLASKLGWNLEITDRGQFASFKIKNPNAPVKEAVNEGYKLQLERDTDMMVLHITDTDTGKRTEVRGKPGYETNGYDANDKLHQLLDKISKTANISELMNGEPVGINPKHPQGASAKDATDKAFNEATEMKISDLTISDAGMAIAHSAGGGSRTDAPLSVTKLPSGYVYLVNGYHRLVDAMNSGKDTVSVEYVPYEKVEILWKQEREQDIKYGKQFNENFADGKVKGKSRPGRVKRSGASCDGSVTELRAKAKKASGEKAKMYHWCANMKAGKKK